VSLSNEPVFSLLKDQFICGYKDIEGKGYAGSSGKHLPTGQAVDTSNGAGPHNIQIFVLAADGTVLHCLPGYWHAEDLATELQFAQQLNKVWQDQKLSIQQKDQLFSQMQLAHLKDHSRAERNRSHMQGFDVLFEKDHRLASTDVFYHNPIDPRTGKLDNRLVKTTDVIMHERMAARPFEPYKMFDTAVYSDYGKPMYDKEEDFRDASGQVVGDTSDRNYIGNDPRAHPVQTEVKKQGKSILRQAIPALVRAAISH